MGKMDECDIQPLVSVIMPCYNAELFIEEAIASVIEQDYTNWELIIVDDNSSDGSINVIRSINENRLKLIRLSENSGSPSTPRNVALSHAKGDFIAFLDSDDIWLPSKLSSQIKFMIDNNSMFSCTAYEIFGLKSGYYYPPNKVTYNDLLLNNSIGCSTAIIHSKLLNGLEFPKCGHEDFALWLKVLRKYDKCLTINLILVNYRVGNGSVSSKKYKLVPFFWNIYRNSEKFSILKSFYFCVRYFINVLWFKYK